MLSALSALTLLVGLSARQYSGTVDSFDAEARTAFRSGLLALAPAAHDAVITSVAAASVVVTSRLLFANASLAEVSSAAIVNASFAELSAALGSAVEAGSVALALQWEAVPDEYALVRRICEAEGALVEVQEGQGG